MTVEQRYFDDPLTLSRATGSTATQGGAIPFAKRNQAETLYLYDSTQKEADAHGAIQVARRVYGAAEKHIRPFRNWTEFQRIVKGYEQIDTLVIDTHGASDEFELINAKNITIKRAAALFERGGPTAVRELAIEGCTLGLYPADLALLGTKLHAAHVSAWLWFRGTRSATLHIARDATEESIRRSIETHSQLGPQWVRYLMPGDEPARLLAFTGKTRQVWFEWFDPNGLEPPVDRKLGAYLTREETRTKIDSFSETEAQARQQSYDGDPFLLSLRQFGPQPFCRISMRLSAR
jgi:hypothetical protein